MNPNYPGSPTGTGSVAGTTGSGTQGLKDKVTDATKDARQKAAELGRTAVDKIDQGRESAAGALQSTASTLRGSGSKLTGAAERAANTLESTADYMRDHDVRRMASDLESVIRRNPGPSLMTALAVGFLLGAAMRRE